LKVDSNEVGDGEGRGGSQKGEKLIDVKLIIQVKEKARRLTRETTGRSKDEVGGNQEVGDVCRVDFAGDCVVVAGRARVLEHGPSIRRDPDKTKGGGIDRCGGGSIVV
jgi:hypothetical protein